MPSDSSARLRRLAELYGTLAVDTQLYELLRAALFQTRSFRLALESGEPVTVARAMGLSAALACITGTERAARYAAELHERGAELAKRASDDDLVVEGPTGRTLCALFLGRPRDVIEHAAAADRAYAIQNFADGHGDYYYMFAVHAARLTALNALGRHSEAREELASYLARADATGNRTAVLATRTNGASLEREAQASQSFEHSSRPIRKYLHGILAYLNTGLSNGRSEGLNGKARVITRRSYGFHSAGSLIAMLFLCCSLPNLAPVHVVPKSHPLAA